MRTILLLCLLFVAAMSYLTTPVLGGFYRSNYKVEFGPKYMQVAGTLNKGH